ncbi:MAG: hypothetical protein WKG00_17470 [Polyangiaceae bacterium]
MEQTLAAGGIPSPKERPLFVQAAKVLEARCEWHDPAACRTLAAVLRGGVGVRKDLARARHLLALLCEVQQDAGACADLHGLPR